MTELRQKMIMELQLRGYTTATVKTYLGSVAVFAKFFNKSPELLGEAELRQYFHHCITEKKLSEVTVNNIHSALKFLYTKVLNRQWNVEKLSRMKQPKKLPVILSQSEVKAILDSAKNPKHKAILMTIYAAGLRVGEVTRLKAIDIDSKNMQIIVRQGKGKKDRHTLLSEINLKVLREYWIGHKPKDYLFPGQKPGMPLTTRTVERIFEAARNKAGIKKNATVHTLRHCFATHLLETETSIFHIQRLMGHKCINTTTRYLQLSRLDIVNIKSPLESIMEDEGDNND